jgi:hypothetical protein
MRVRVVPELGDERVALEGRLHDAALDAAAPTVHETHLPQARLVSGTDVFLDNGRDVTRAERVEIELGLDRDGVRLGHVGAIYRAGLTSENGYTALRLGRSGS